MKYYFDFLKKKNLKVNYLEFQKDLLKHFINTQRLSNLVFYEPINHDLKDRIIKTCKGKKIEICFIENPMLINSQNEFKSFFDTDKHLSMNSFYIDQRKKNDILISAKKPIGGQWSFDKDNRSKFDSNIKVPPILNLKSNKYIKEATKYINENFAKNPGDTDNFIYPVTHSDAKNWVDDFIENRLDYFGRYEDAIDTKEQFLFHSLLSSPLNIGLLTPIQVIEQALAKKKTPINSLEAFIRQIIGWREFMAGVYLFRNNNLKKSNFWKFDRKIPASFYTAKTGIEPIDHVISNVILSAYAHHIERLMILGNFMLLCEISPSEVCRWFMELFIDAYDWVMTPNIFAMSQYAEGGTITTKPYISSSNYIRKMSDFKAGNWCQIWDALYWHFIKKHQAVFKQNPRMKIMSIQIDKMDSTKLKNFAKKS